jgi:hypothetical protein
MTKEKNQVKSKQSIAKAVKSVVLGMAETKRK